MYILYRHADGRCSDHTYCVSLEGSEARVKPGQTVHMLRNTSIVGKAKTMEGNRLHGHIIPDSFIRVFIDTIEENIPPLFRTTFDGPCLEAGGITAWPVDQCVVCE